MIRPYVAIFIVWCCTLGLPSNAQDSRIELAYAQAPVDNPLKGLVPYQADVRKRFPHSMEFNYLPYSALVKGYDKFDWAPLETMLEDIASRGHQAVFRVFLEYPNKQNIIPNFLLQDGLTVHKYLNTNTQPFPPAKVETPDYENEDLRRSLKNFISALGKKYDGDPRIGFITAGLLGTWGEWHTHPRSELFASRTVQREIMASYEAAFDITPVLLRYPAGDMHYNLAENANRRFGYHDDSFAWATLETGEPNDSWFYIPALKAAGPLALDKWKSHPIGGEIRPEAWGQVFDEKPTDPMVQDFALCVKQTHASWLMDSGMFEKQQSSDRIRRAEQQVLRMGYEFHIPSVTMKETQPGIWTVSVELENRGVAPFYYDWEPKFLLLNGNRVIRSYPCSMKLVGLLSGDGSRTSTDTLDLSQSQKGTYVLALHCPNPMPKGRPVGFANASYDLRNGWLVLGEIESR